MRSRLAHASAGFGLFSWLRRLTLAISTVSILTVTAAPALAGGPAEAPAASQAHRQQAENQTLALARLMAAYRHADGAEQANLLNELLDQASERQALLAELAQTDPAGALRAVLPAQERTGMPAEVQALLEQKQVVEGELEVFYEDYEDGHHRLRHVLNTGTDRIELQLPTSAQSRNLQTGTPVRARGWLFRQEGATDGSLVLSDEPQSLKLLADGATTTSGSSTAALPNTLGEQKLLVLLVNFQDNPAQPWTPEQARSMVFDTVNAFYRENSNSQTWLTGDVQGYFTLPMAAACDTTQIELQAKQAAADYGIDISHYNRLIYLFPQISSCGWTGKGTVGGTPSRAWINGSLELRTIGHELGHNLGLQHAKRLECGANTIGGDCYTVEYGDSLDIMGSPGFTGHFNAFNKAQLGWLEEQPSAAAGQLMTADTDGTYQLEPYEVAPGGVPKALRIQRGVDAVTGQKLWYYLEYRQPQGFDNYLAGYPAITKGVAFHLATENDMNSSQWIDMTPASASADWNDAVLPVGASFTDPDAGVTVSTDWADASGASVTVSYEGQSCIRANPTLLLSPAESAWLPAGSTVTYTATLTNRDSSGCGASDFNLSALLPAGWSVNTASLNLVPGASGSVTLSVTSASSAGDGFYDIAIKAVNGSDANYASSGTVTYVVQAAAPVCAPANPTLVLTAGQSQPVPAGSSVTYTATLTNQDSSTCAASVFDVGAGVPAGWSAGSTSVSLAPGASTSVNVSVTSASNAADGQYAISLLAANRSEAGFGASLQSSYAVAAPAPVCVAAEPQLTLAPANSEPVAPGSTLTYSVTLTNRDSSDCTASDFALSAQLPAGWSAGSPSVHLAPGTSATVNLAVNLAADAADGSYAIAIRAQNLTETGYGSSVPVSIAVAAPVNQAPVAMDDTLSLSAKVASSIRVLANDSDPDLDPLTVVSVTQGAKGSVQISADGNLLYTPAKSFKDSDSFSYTISDGGKTASATVYVTLASTGGNSGKGNGK